MAPELIRIKNNDKLSQRYDPFAADIFAFGIVILIKLVD